MKFHQIARPETSTFIILTNLLAALLYVPYRLHIVYSYRRSKGSHSVTYKNVPNWLKGDQSVIHEYGSRSLERARYVAYGNESSWRGRAIVLNRNPFISRDLCRDIVQDGILVERTLYSARINENCIAIPDACDVSDDGGSATTSESSGHLLTSAKSSQTSKNVSNSQRHRPSEQIGEDDDSDEKPPPDPSHRESCSHLDEQGVQCPILVSGIAAKTFSSCQTRRKEFSHTVYAHLELK